MLDCFAWKEKRSKLYYFTCFYVMLYDFLNCPACIDIKQTLHYKVAIERSFYAFFLMFVSHFLVVVLDRLFFVRKTKKRLLAALDR